MPTYQYACTACDERLEAVQTFTDAPLTECPACGGALRKVFSAVGVVFKGSGFYKTDSRSAAKKAEAPAAKSDSGSSDGGKSDKAAAASTAPSTGSSTSSSSSDSGSSTKPAKPAASSTPASKSA